jgi:uncharacterized protein involved in exopolysaccharide biosynthesis
MRERQDTSADGCGDAHDGREAAGFHVVDSARVVEAVWRRKFGMAFVALIVMCATAAWTYLLAPRVYVARGSLFALDGAQSPMQAMQSAGLGGAALLGILPASGGDGARFISILESEVLQKAVARDLGVVATLVDADWQKARAARGRVAVTDADSVALALLAQHPDILDAVAADTPGQGVYSMSDATLRELVAAIPAIAGAPDDAQLQLIRTRWLARLERALAQLRDTIRVARDPEQDLIEIRAEFVGDGELPALIANQCMSELDVYLRDHALSRTRRKREMVQQQVARAADAISHSDDALEGFQRTYGVISLPEQARQLIEQSARLGAELEAERVLYAVASEVGLAPAGVEMKANDHRVKALARQLQALELTGGQDPFGLHAGIAELPLVQRRYAELARDRAVNDSLYALLAEQLEVARIEEAQDEPAFRILDHAQPSARPVRPKHLLNLVMGALIGACLSVLYAAAREFLAAKPRHGAGAGAGDPVSSES